MQLSYKCLQDYPPFSFTPKHCSKLPFSLCRKSCNCQEAAEALEIIFHCVSCFYACRLYQTSSSPVQFVCSCHNSHKTFHFCTHNKNKWPYSLQSRCCFSSMIVSRLQGCSSKTWAPKHVSNSKMKLNDFIFYASVKKTFFCLQNSTKNKITRPHIFSLQSSSL